MDKFQEQLENIQSQSLDSKKSWYSNVAVSYHKSRPHYPDQLLDQIIDLTQLSPNSPILEIGCGPGIATTKFAELGFVVSAIEPSKEASELAKQNCQNYPHVDIINTTFEEWTLEPEKFDAIFMTTSFHWLSPEIATQKSAAALKENGFVVLLWNTPPQPSQEIYENFLLEIYNHYAPSLFGYRDIKTYLENLNQFGEQLIDSGYFKNLVTGQVVTEITYSVERYLMLLSTLSPYMNLDSRQRDRLFMKLKETLHNNVGNSFITHYLSAFHLAQKTSTEC